MMCVYNPSFWAHKVLINNRFSSWLYVLVTIQWYLSYGLRPVRSLIFILELDYDILLIIKNLLI